MRGARRRGRRLLRRERDLGARRAAPARREPRRPRRGVRLRATPARGGGRRRTGRASTGATRCGCARQESALGSVTGGNGSIYAVDRRRLRRGRPALGPRPLVPVPDGAERPACGLRARRRSPSRSRRRRTRPSTAARCACSSTAGRSRCAARCCATCRPAISCRCSRTALLRYGSGVLHLALLGDERRARRRRRRCTRSCSRGQLALLGAAAAGVPIARYYALVTWATVRRALELPAARRARDVGGGGGHALTPRSST